MIGLMEDAAFNVVEKLLPPGYSTVGTNVHVVHLAACPQGQTVVATAVLLKQDGRRLDFRVEARSGEVLLGEGTHERAIINVERFVGRIAETWRLSEHEARRVEGSVQDER
jgi:predicted thioesterase